MANNVISLYHNRSIFKFFSMFGKVVGEFPNSSSLCTKRVKKELPPNSKKMQQKEKEQRTTTFSWLSLLFGGCGSANITNSRKKSSKKKKNRVSKQVSMTRLSFKDFSNSDSPEDLSISLVGSNLHIFTLAELKVVTQNFSTSNFVGEGGFGPVYKGHIDDKVRPGLKPQAVAVKLLDLEGLAGRGDLSWAIEAPTSCEADWVLL